MSDLSNWERKARVRGAKLHGQAMLPLPINDHPLDFTGTVIWASDGFFSTAQSTQVTVPPRCRAVYSIHAVVHWGIFDSETFFPEVRDGNYFITQVAKNGDVSGQMREARATDAPTIQATITRQEVLWETELRKNDTIQVLISSQVVEQTIMDRYVELYQEGWKYQLEYWLTVRRLGKLT